MEFIKYYVNEWFNKEQFTDLLNRNGVKATITDNGIILDRAAFNSIKPAFMPHWMYLNKEYINSVFHTRKATPDEYKDLI